jgi:hypothetical protein
MSEETKKVTFGTKGSETPPHEPVGLDEVLPGSIFSIKYSRYDDDMDDDGEPLWELDEKTTNLQDFLQYMKENQPTKEEEETKELTAANTAANTSSMNVKEFVKKLKTHKLVNFKLLRNNKIIFIWEMDHDVDKPMEKSKLDPLLLLRGKKRKLTQVQEVVTAETSPGLFAYLSRLYNDFRSRGGRRTKRRKTKRSTTKRRKTKRSTTKRRTSKRKSSKKK